MHEETGRRSGSEFRVRGARRTRRVPGVDRPELPGLSRACRVLATGGAVVVPNPAPMAYGVVATRAHAVNALKGRPLDQNVAVSLHEVSQWLQVMPSIDLPPANLDAVVALLARRVSVLVPLHPRVPHPDWCTPAVRDGYLAAFDGYWSATAGLWGRFPRLYGSSANPTGQPPAASAAQAVAMFGPDVVVLGSDDPDGPSGPRQASAMVRINPDGLLDLYRTGAQDGAHPLKSRNSLRRLAVTVGLPGTPSSAESRIRRTR